MSEKKFKQVCKCEHCGSEAEMRITSTLAEDLPQQSKWNMKRVGVADMYSSGERSEGG